MGLREALTPGVVVAGLVLIGGGLFVAILPDLVAPPRVPTPAKVEVAAVSAPAHEVPQALEEALGLESLEVIAQEGGRLQIRSPQGRSAQDAASAVAVRLKAGGLEAYVRRVDEFESLLRVYGDAATAVEVAVIGEPQGAAAPQTHGPALLAVILSGVGPKPLPRLPDVPLTVAVTPYAPHSLRAAEDAARAWHEVVVTLSPQDEPKAARDAVPFATGFIAQGFVPQGLPPGVVIGYAGRPPSAGGRSIAVLSADSATEAMRRARTVALREGAAAVLLPIDDAGTSEALAWFAKHAITEGFRPVHLSEAARPAQVRGPPDEAAPPPATP